MNKKAQLLKGIAAVAMLLLLGMNAQAQCPNTAAAITQQGTDCGANVNYAVTNDVGFQSIQWFLDNGLLNTQPSGTIYLDPGSYVFRVITIDANNCTNVYEEVVVVGLNFSVTIVDGDGGIACNGTLLLNSIVTGGSGNFAYQWSPANMMDSPTASATAMGVGSGTTEVTLTVTDLTLGCSFSDSTMVYPNLPITETLELCGTGDVAELVVDPGSMVYNWTAEDPDGNPIDMSGVTGNSFTASELGTYEVMTYYSGCNQVVHEFEVVECPLPCELAVDFIFEDFACNGTLQLDMNTTGGSGDYSFAWEPASLMSDPTAEYPTVNVGNDTATVSVTVTDNETGCEITESITVYPNVQQIQTLELCSGSAELTLDPGSLVYSWTATDPDGNTIDMSGVTGNSFDATLPGDYVVVTYYSGCNVITHQFEVEESTLQVGISSGGNPPYACFGECYYVSASGSGGTTPYTVVWSDGSTSWTLEACTGGDYTATVTDAAGCASTASINIPGCPDECNSWFTYTQNCHQVCFTADGSHDIETYMWDFGDGQTSMDDEPCHYFIWPTTYDVQLTAIHTNGCTSTSSVSVEVGQATVEAFEVIVPDTVYACQDSCAQVSVEVIGGVAPYTFDWNTGQTGPNVQFCSSPPFTYILHVYDSNGCEVIKEIAMLQHPTPEFEIVLSETTENCITNVCLTVMPEFESHLWYTGSATQTICGLSAIGMHDAQVWILDVYGCVHTDSLSFTIEAPCDDVWPGDADSDGEVTNTDALWVGIAFDETGPVRPDASLTWEGQPAPDWNFNFSGINVNLKHADTDGNGTVNFADTVAISLNYGQTHGKTENALAGSIPALWVEAVPDTVAPGGGVVATVHLGSATQPVDSLHGIAFTLTFNDMLVDDADFSIDFSGNALGTVGSDVMTLQKLFLPDGEVDVAITRNTLQNFAGYGPLATFHIVTTDNLSGIHELRIGVSGVSAITAHGHAVELATVADTVIIDSDFVGIGEAFGADLRIHPNPTSGLVRVNGLQGDVTVEVLDATGRVISRSGNNGSTALTLDLSGQPEGFYLLRLSGAEGVAVRRLVLTS